jgi:magnesium transporter
MSKYKQMGMARKVGLPPGSLVYVGRDHPELSNLELIRYDQQQSEMIAPIPVDGLKKFLWDSGVNWVNLEGLKDVDLVTKVGNLFNLDNLMLEDILNTEQRPGSEYSSGYLLITLKMFHGHEGNKIIYEQISLVLKSNCVITFQERSGDVFDIIRNRLQQPENRLKKMRADYLFYRLIDTVVDNYFLVLDNLAAHTEWLEDQVFETPDEETLKEIQVLKKELIYLLRAVLPLRESIGSLIRERPTGINEETIDYLKDAYGHSVQVLETVETYQDIVSGLLNIYMNNISQRMNEVMKVLTIMASIFIPLSFFAGIYGMNFNNMPELNWKWGYFVLLGFMLTLGLSMVLYFRNKKWF